MDKLLKLQGILTASGPVAIAVSGGVDSMTLAVIAHRVNAECQMFHAISPAVPGQATDRVRRYAQAEGWDLHLIDAGEIHDPDYVANPANRCYFCKTNLYDTVCEGTELPVVSGTNTDDLGDYRPGLTAAAEHRVEHPFVQAGISKTDIRAIAAGMGLSDLKDLPAAPCLSSRVMTGIAIDEHLLPVINEAELALTQSLQKFIPLLGVRCRIRPDEVAIEIETVDAIDVDSEYAQAAREIVIALFQRHGYSHYLQTVSVEPYRRGSAFLIDTLQVS